MRSGLLLTVLLLAGCADDGLTRNFGLARDSAPDTVAATQIPLSVPPSLALRPTRPGAPVPRSTAAAEPQVGSAGQDALLQAAGPSSTADIRQLINENSGLVDPGPGFTDQLLNWTPPPGATSLSQPAKKGWLSRMF
jgi:hypothetical protein